MWQQFAPTKAGPEKGTLEQVPRAALLVSGQGDSHPFIPCSDTPGDWSATASKGHWASQPLGQPRQNPPPPRAGRGEGTAAPKGVRVGSPALPGGGLQGRSPARAMLLPASSRIPGPPSPPRGRRPQRQLPGTAGAVPRPPHPVSCPCFPGEALPAKANIPLRVPWEPPKQSHPTGHASEKNSYCLPPVPSFTPGSVLHSPVREQQIKATSDIQMLPFKARVQAPKFL